MDTPVVALPTIQQLSDYIHRTLCDNDRLDPRQTPMFRSPIKRGKRLVGAMFFVQGPRLLRTSAIWAAEEFRIIFYDSTGKRFLAVRLSESPTAEAELPTAQAA